MLRYLCVFFLIVMMTIETTAQQRWVPFFQETRTAPSVTLSHSNSSSISFSIKINGMSATGIKVGETSYQQISIPDAEVMTQEGLPQVPVITKLVAIPDCDHVSIAVTHSNKFGFGEYNILPTPRHEKKKLPDGTEVSVEVFEENKSVYSSTADFPGKYGEIIDTGHVRGQKVARVAIYPVQFSPAGRTITVFSDFAISLTFSNPSPQVNKELGIFRHMMHRAALNYELDGIGASKKDSGSVFEKRLGKTATGSVTRVTDLSSLVGPSALAVDYLIITYSSLFNSNSLTTLANHRRDYNGYDVAIVHVDDMTSGNDCVYEFYPRATFYQSIRDFVADVYNNGRATHIGDGHLGYILLVGDALKDDNSSVMLPAAYPATYYSLEQGSDYYYACTGGDYDEDLDLMYGRLSVGNEAELSANVSKIISYEYNTNGSWCDDYTFVSFSPTLFSYADPAIAQMTQTVPPSCSKSYAYRAYDTSPASLVTGATHPIFGQRFTLAQYNDGNYVCGADLLVSCLRDTLSKSCDFFED